RRPNTEAGIWERLQPRGSEIGAVRLGLDSGGVQGVDLTLQHGPIEVILGVANHALPAPNGVQPALCLAGAGQDRDVVCEVHSVGADVEDESVTVGVDVPV